MGGPRPRQRGGVCHELVPRARRLQALLLQEVLAVPEHRDAEVRLDPVDVPVHEEPVRHAGQEVIQIGGGPRWIQLVQGEEELERRQFSHPHEIDEDDVRGLPGGDGGDDALPQTGAPHHLDLQPHGMPLVPLVVAALRLEEVSDPLAFRDQGVEGRGLCLRHVGPAPLNPVKEPLLHQLGDGLAHREPADPQEPGELPLGGDLVPGLQTVAFNPGTDVLLELLVKRPLWLRLELPSVHLCSKSIYHHHPHDSMPKKLLPATWSRLRTG